MSHGRQGVIVVGAGIGGLTAAMLLAARGIPVTVLEQAGAPGGKMRRVECDGYGFDAGPTVMTLRPVFEEVFAEANGDLSAEVALEPLKILARHAWSADEVLDLHSDPAQSVEAVAAFSGRAEARRLEAFQRRARRAWEVLEPTFLRQMRPGMRHFMGLGGLARLPDLWRSAPFNTLWGALGNHFRDPRLRQLFGRYATYCGSSPFLAPATLMLIAHVEQQGVWSITGGMHRLAEAMAARAIRLGATIRYGARVLEVFSHHGRVGGVRLAGEEALTADAVILNSDPGAAAGGMLGSTVQAVASPLRTAQPSLSAVTLCFPARVSGFDLCRHSVFFSRDYAREFRTLQTQRRLPDDPTVYVCAQDRADDACVTPDSAERIFMLINAPAMRDSSSLSPAEIGDGVGRAHATLVRCGLRLDSATTDPVLTTPHDFARLFPGSGGALYGQATHGWRSSFTRPTARTALSGLYRAGGGVHPGAGVPMAALSGRYAARAIFADWRV